MNKIQLIDAETLYYKPLAHPRMLIDGILADGLAVMAGDSKIGKSWIFSGSVSRSARASRYGASPPGKPTWCIWRWRTGSGASSSECRS